MDLETFLVAVYCLTDDAIENALHGSRLRQRGPAPRPRDSEVIAIEVAGEYLGLETDYKICRYFRRHWFRLYPRLKTVHRTTFLRQAANLWRVKEAIRQHLLQRVRHDPALSILDSRPVPVCRFARAQVKGFPLLAPFQTAEYEKTPWPHWLVQKRRRIDMVLAQLVERYSSKRTWARDIWHLCSRWLRKVLSHMVAVLLRQQNGLGSLAFSQLVAA